LQAFAKDETSEESLASVRTLKLLIVMITSRPYEDMKPFSALYSLPVLKLGE